MARIDVRGDIIPNEYKWYYDYFEYDGTCPRDVQRVIDTANGEELEVYINSGGGVISAGSEIYTMLKKYSGNVKIYIMGAAHSAASVIAMAGYSEMSPTALMMVHCVSAGANGNHNAMEKAAEMLRTADRAMCTAYMEKTGMTETQALEMMEQETWLNAQQAKERGMIDAVMFEEPKDTNAVMIGSLFRLPSKEKMNEIKKMVDAKKHSAIFNAQKAQATLNLLKITGGREIK